MKMRISDLMGSIGDTSVALSPAPALSAERIRARTLEKLQLEPERENERRGGTRRAGRLLRTVLIAAAVMSLMVGTALAARRLFSGIRSMGEDLAIEGTEGQVESRADPRYEAQRSLLRQAVSDGGAAIISGWFYYDGNGCIQRQPATVRTEEAEYILQTDQWLETALLDGKLLTVFLTAEGQQIAVTGDLNWNETFVLLEEEGRILSYDPDFLLSSVPDRIRALRDGTVTLDQALPEGFTLKTYVSADYQLASRAEWTPTAVNGERVSLSIGEADGDRYWNDPRDSWPVYHQVPDYAAMRGWQPDSRVLLPGVSGSPEAEAYREWQAWLDAHPLAENSPGAPFLALFRQETDNETSEEWLALLEANPKMQDPVGAWIREKHGEEMYRAWRATVEADHSYDDPLSLYGAYDEEGAAALREILDKYGLKAADGHQFGETPESMRALGMPDFLDDMGELTVSFRYTLDGQTFTEERKAGGYMYTNGGGFKLEGCPYRLDNENGFWYTVVRFEKGFLPFLGSTANTDWYTEWDYETKDGVVIHVCASEARCILYADLPGAFVSITIDRGTAALPEYGLTALTPADLEAFADYIRWTALG